MGTWNLKANIRGISITNALVASDGHLRVTLSSGTVIDAGQALGATGAQGLPGVNAVANDTATAGYISTAGTSATKSALAAATPANWTPATAYTLGQKVTSPGGDIVSAIAAHTSGAVYTAANWAPTATTAAQPKPVGNTVVLLGDSITKQGTSNAGANDPDDGTYSYSFNNIGYFGWLQTLMGHRFRLLRNAGVSGERTDQILLRVDSGVHAYNPAWCIVLAGTNDIIQSVPEATLKTNLGAIYDALLAKGVRVVACTIPANNTATTTAQKQAMHGANGFIRDYVRSHPGMVLVDWHAATADPSTGLPATSTSVDGTHPSCYGAWRLATVMSNALTPLVPPSLSMLGSNSDPYNLLTNGRFQGSGGSLSAGMTGVLAASWNTQWLTTAGTAVLSQVPRTDGILGSWQQIQLTGAGTFAMYQQANPLSVWGLSPGDKVQLEIEFDADADWSGITRFGTDVSWFNGGSGYGDTLLNSDATWATVNPRKGVLRTPVTIIPPTAARAQVYVRFYGTAGTVRFDRARLVKVLP
jgi:lysophospholipase L1-like esterase